MYRGGVFIGSKVLCKFELQREKGEKREGMQISKQITQNLWPKKYLQPCAVCFNVLKSPVPQFTRSQAARNYSWVVKPLTTNFARNHRITSLKQTCCVNAEENPRRGTHIQGWRYFLGQRFSVLCSEIGIPSPFFPSPLWSANFKIKTGTEPLTH